MRGLGDRREKRMIMVLLLNPSVFRGWRKSISAGNPANAFLAMVNARVADSSQDGQLR